MLSIVYKVHNLYGNVAVPDRKSTVETYYVIACSTIRISGIRMVEMT